MNNKFTFSDKLRGRSLGEEQAELITIAADAA
jgi:hypothetical protein